MKKIALLASLALMAGAHADTLYNNGPVYDLAGAPNYSQLISPNSTFGFGAQTSANNAVADDFTAGATWNVSKLTFYMYQTGATAFSFSPTISPISA